MKRYVIIGNGVAAVGCIEGIRSADGAGEITVISAEPHPVYCRPLISYYLEGKTDLQRMQYRDGSFLANVGCTVRYGVRAQAIDPQAKTVALSDGAQLPYDALCVAAGSSPFLPPMQGLETVPRKFTFQTLDDALALEQAITPESRVLIVGAGLIGLKCAEGLHARVGRITVCDLADRVLSSILDAAAAARVQKHLEAQGIRFLLGDSVAQFSADFAEMKSGETVPFDVLVLAVGVRPNTSLVKEAGGETDRGILIDERMATTLPDVYAAGDCAQGYDRSCGARRVLALLPNAYLQGHAAGVNMAGGCASFDRGIPMNSIGFFGLHLMTAGSYDGEVIAADSGEAYKRFFVKDDRLTGFILIGGTDRAGIYTAMVREQTPLHTVDFSLLTSAATSAAFSPAVRTERFGGAV
ncbi:MAG: NAD(P)/FAD-dependent oxidoreductase [Clostridia bacterium]|nr:NAD(P)/FAD-dependent oxidoreductase [Clostridia bacterium]